MEKTRILIADPSTEFCNALENALSGDYQISTCRDGIRTMELLRSFSPDILVLDLMLPGMDGITLLQKCGQMGITPVVLATSRYVSDYVLHAAQRLGVGYFMVKPCDVDAVTCRIADMAQGLRPSLFGIPDRRSRISSILLQLGFSTKLRGYGYLREAVLLMAEDPKQSVTKELYPAVGAQCGANVAQVERSIRNAITAAWSRCTGQAWELYFPESKETRPTNAVVISRLVDELLAASGEREKTSGNIEAFAV